jgi:hypothetical protein
MLRWIVVGPFAPENLSGRHQHFSPDYRFFIEYWEFAKCYVLHDLEARVYWKLPTVSECKATAEKLSEPEMVQ